MALPEFLTGAPFQEYKYEGTIVNAFSMAILQELNTRNVLNPVSALRGEVNYSSDSTWRADLHMDLRELRIFTDALRKYGYYEENWMEVKFFRKGESGKPVVPALKSTFLLLNDLIRLCTLVPDNLAGEKSKAARYLLHAYQGDPWQYLTKSRNDHGRRSERLWVDQLTKPGRHEVEIHDLKKEESKSFQDAVGKQANQIKLNAVVSNLVHSPYQLGDENYYIVLTRIDSFRVKVASRWYARREQVLHESHEGLSLSFPRLISGLIS
ncbi:hypothetical protein [Marinobacter nauticus]|uniref:hypothetical protein n=1 Tax=Marinobacter nauticus TaxID=2743 RepID=UPI004044CF98